MENTPKLNLAYIVDDYEDFRLDELQKETKYRIDQLILSKNFRLTNLTETLKFYASAFDYLVEIIDIESEKIFKTCKFTLPQFITHYRINHPDIKITNEVDVYEQLNELGEYTFNRNFIIFLNAKLNE